MKRETLYELFGDLDDGYVCEARAFRGRKTVRWLKWGAAAACFVLILTAAITVIPTVLEEDTPVPSHEHGTEALMFERSYCYFIDDGRFSAYVGGKVIDEEKIGGKIEDVSVTAGWIDSNQTWSDTETLRAEVYAIIGIPTETAAALKFIDQGEAVTTTHYYVILNPDADLSAVEEYRIARVLPNLPDQEMGEAVPES